MRGVASYLLLATGYLAAHKLPTTTGNQTPIREKGTSPNVAVRMQVGAATFAASETAFKDPRPWVWALPPGQGPLFRAWPEEGDSVTTIRLYCYFLRAQVGTVDSTFS